MDAVEDYTAGLDEVLSIISWCLERAEATTDQQAAEALIALSRIGLVRVRNLLGPDDQVPHAAEPLLTAVPRSGLISKAAA